MFEGAEKSGDAGATAQTAIALQSVRKVYGSGAHGFLAIDDVSFDIADNSFFTLLGPSGCGKTTLLKMIAGFEATTGGAIRLFGEEIEALPPNKRPINTVFQHYALFPHMTVVDNVGFGLRMLGWARRDIAVRVEEMLALVQMADLGGRKPSALSGGQQQRVALARALAPAPKVLLLDEPLSALDLKLRQAMREELKRIQMETGITFVFVTHDQEEALTMSDQIAVMSNGRVQQIGAPRDIYETPRNRFVADFIGETNILDVTIGRIEEGRALCRLAGGAALSATPMGDVVEGAKGHISIRPERITLASPDGAGDDALAGVVDRIVYLGTDTQHAVRLGDGSEVLVRTQNAHGAAFDAEPGAKVALRVDDGAPRLLVD